MNSPDYPFPDRYALSFEVAILPHPAFLFDFQRRLVITAVPTEDARFKFIGCCLDDSDPAQVPVADVLQLVRLWMAEEEFTEPTLPGSFDYVLMSRAMLHDSLEQYGGLPDWLVIHEPLMGPDHGRPETSIALLSTRPWAILGFAGEPPGERMPFLQPFFFAGPEARPSPFGPWQQAARDLWIQLLPVITGP